MNKWSSDLPKHCEYCGGYMIRKDRKNKEFDILTGELSTKVEYVWRCEKVRWWSGLSFRFHKDYLVIEDPQIKIGDMMHRVLLEKI